MKGAWNVSRMMTILQDPVSVADRNEQMDDSYWPRPATVITSSLGGGRSPSTLMLESLWN
jgi:hypothetical protein